MVCIIMDKIITRTATITLIKESFVKMIMHEDAILDLQDMIDNHTAEQEISNGKPHVILIDTRANSMSSDEARRYSSGEKPTHYRIAVALLFNGLAGRIGANSLINLYNPKVPTEKFIDEEKALQWLETFL